MLILRGLSKVYRTGDVDVPVLHDVNLEIFRGEVMVVVGPSGSGKSTLLNMVGGIDRPTAGDVVFEEETISRFSDAELTAYRRREIAFVFQFYNLVPTLTALENVLVATQLSDDPVDAREALSLVGLSDRISHFPAQLSGGEQQRVSIARAVAKKPRLLLCDEPTGALDLTTGRHVLGALASLNNDLGMTIIIITHNSAIAAIAHRKVRIGSGTIAEVSRNSNRVDPEDIVW